MYKRDIGPMPIDSYVLKGFKLAFTVIVKSKFPVVCKFHFFGLCFWGSPERRFKGRFYHSNREVQNTV